MATVNEKMTAIADAIREKTGGTDKLTLDNMAQGVGEVYDVGRQAQYDEFWDAYQKPNGNVIYSAQYLFAGSGWDNKTFKPTHSMTAINSANNMFNMCRITDLRSILKEQGVTFSFKNCTSFGNIIAYSSITHFPDVVTTKASALTSFLNQAYNLVSMGLVTLKDDGSQTFSGAFSNCTKLQDISFAGAIGNNVDMHWSPLSKESITSVINALSDTVTGKTLTLSLAAMTAAFTDEEWATLIATKSNWTISLA